ADRLRRHRRIARGSRAQEAVRHHPDLELLRPRGIGVDDDGLVLRLLPDDRLLSATPRRGFALNADPIDARRRLLEIDRTRVALVRESRPLRTWIRRLTEHEIGPGGGVLNGLQTVDAHGFRRSGDDRS